MIGGVETVVDVYVERKETDELESSCEFLIEPCKNFNEKVCLVMASTLFDIDSGPTYNVRILTPFQGDVTSKQDACIGIAKRAGKIENVLAEKDHVLEEENLCSVRRVTHKK